MFRSLLAAAMLAAALMPAAAQEAGLAIILDVQNPEQVAGRFCVYESKVYSQNSEVCVSKSSKLTCRPLAEDDPLKGLAWVQEDDQKRCASAAR
ncbi:MAG: hypothetical protein GC199_09400 [Alphaproteobacteria bacterium]|nr:hypothetical protein [Alphaproteobacteria bacterium]